MGANEAERRRWNDERRYSIWPKRERLTSEVTTPLLGALRPRPGEHIVDVGSGGGTSTLAAARAVGPEGMVVGVDISAALCRLARERAAATASRNVSFVLGDAQTETIAGGPFDAAMSQFGVMFFDQPVAAFRNIHRHLRPGGRLAFACWGAREANPWYFADAVAGFLPAPPELAPGTSPTGPFALADPGRTTSILETAGFTDVRHTTQHADVVAPEDSVLDEAQLVFMGVPDDQLAAAMDVAKRYLNRFKVDDERSRFPLCFEIFSAARL